MEGEGENDDNKRNAFDLDSISENNIGQKRNLLPKVKNNPYKTIPKKLKKIGMNKSVFRANSSSCWLSKVGCSPVPELAPGIGDSPLYSRVITPPKCLHRKPSATEEEANQEANQITK